MNCNRCFVLRCFSVTKSSKGTIVKRTSVLSCSSSAAAISADDGGATSLKLNFLSDNVLLSNVFFHFDLNFSVVSIKRVVSNSGEED